MLTFNAVLTRKTPLPGSVDLLSFSLAPGERFVFTPGQYVILTVPHEVLPVKRLYSIASAASQTGSFELLVKCVPGGIASGYIERLKEGQTVDFQGPAGLFTLKESPHGKVFLATGTGIAPIRSILRSNPGHTQPYRLFWGVSTYKELYLLDELNELCLKDPLFRFTVCLSREQSLEAVPEKVRSCFSLGRISENLEGIQNDSPQTTLEYYICGRREMVESMREYLYSRHTDKELVFFERY